MNRENLRNITTRNNKIVSERSIELIGYMVGERK